MWIRGFCGFVDPMWICGFDVDLWILCGSHVDFDVDLDVDSCVDPICGSFCQESVEAMVKMFSVGGLAWTMLSTSKAVGEII